MLKFNKMIGFLLTKDAKRSRKFYEEILGFLFKSEDEFALVLETDANRIRISKVNDFLPAPHTVLGWEVTKIEEVADCLSQNGVIFERYPWMQQNAGGIWNAPSGDKVVI